MNCESILNSVKSFSAEQAASSSPLAAVPRILHDARTGFHDIKPPPQFYPPSLWPIVLITTVLLFGLTLVYIWRKRTSSAQLQAVVAQSPEQTALAELQSLEHLRKEKGIQLREFSSRLSFALRVYIEQRFPLPARDQTRRELIQRLPQTLKKALPCVPRSLLEELSGEIDSVLRFCEQATFAENAEASYSLESPLLIEQIQISAQTIRKLKTWLQKETERTEGIVASSKLGAVNSNFADQGA